MINLMMTWSLMLVTPRAGSGVVRIYPLRFLAGRMSYKVTKPGLVLLYILACFNCVVAY